MRLVQRLSATLLVVATTAGATFTVLVAGGSGSLDIGVIRVTFLVMAAVALLPWLAVAVWRPSWSPSSRLMPALLFSIAVFAVSTITSRAPRLSVEMLGYAVLISEVYVLLVALMRRPAMRLHLERLALTMCVLVCALYLIEVFQAWIVLWGLVGHIAIPPLRPGYQGLLIGPNPIATVALVLGSFGLASHFGADRAGRAAIVLLIALVLATTFVTGSRGAWFGAGLGSMAAIVAALVVMPDVRPRLRSILRSRLVAMALLIGIPLAGGGAALAALSGRLTLGDPGYRAGFTHASLQMFDSAPLTGVGPGTWATLRAANSRPTDLDLYIPHAHSIYFQTLAEFGFLGIIAGVVLVIALAGLIVRSVRSGDPVRQRVAYAGLFGIVLLAGQQFADMLMNVPAVLLAIALPIAWLDARSFDDPEGQTSQPAAGLVVRGLPLAMALAVGVVLVGLARIESAAGIAGEGVDAANSGDWQLAAQLSREALRQDPDLNLYRFQAGVAEANAGDLTGATRDLEAAALVDDYRYAWLDLAAAKWKAGDDNGARDALDRAERLGLQRAPVAIAAGWLRLQLGDEGRAITDFAAGLNLLPTLADDPFWDSASGPPGGIQGVVGALPPDTDPNVRLQIHLILGDTASAAEDLRILSPTEPELYAAIMAAWLGDDVAWATMQSLASTNPLDGTIVSWSRFVAMYRGDDQLSGDYERLVTITGSPNVASPFVGRISFGSILGSPLDLLDDYGTLYRRPNLRAQVIAPLPQLVLQDHP